MAGLEAAAHFVLGLEVGARRDESRHARMVPTCRRDDECCSAVLRSGKRESRRGEEHLGVGGLEMRLWSRKVRVTSGLLWIDEVVSVNGLGLRVRPTGEVFKVKGNFKAFELS